MQRILQGSHFGATLELRGGLTARCFPLKENKDMIIFEFCSLMNLGMRIINKSFLDWFACTIFIHSLCKTNSLFALVHLFTQLVNKNRTRSPTVK